jgi:cell division protein FtsB
MFIPVRLIALLFGLLISLVFSLPALAQQHPVMMHAVVTQVAANPSEIAQMQQQLVQQQADIAALKAELAGLKSSNHSPTAASRAFHGRVSLSKRPPSTPQNAQTLTARSNDISSRLRTCLVSCDSISQRVWRLGAARDAMKQLYQSLGTCSCR